MAAPSIGSMAPTAALHPIAGGVAAWLGDGPFGRPNAGVVVDADGLTLVDTLMVPSQWEPFGDALDQLGRHVRRVVLTSSHIPFVGGTGRSQCTTMSRPCTEPVRCVTAPSDRSGAASTRS